MELHVVYVKSQLSINTDTNAKLVSIKSPIIPKGVSYLLHCFSYLGIPIGMLLNAGFKPLYSAPILSSFQVGWIKTGWFGVIFELNKFAFPVLVQTILFCHLSDDRFPRLLVAYT